MLTTKDIEDFQNYVVPKDGHHYHWVRTANLPRAGWEELDKKVGDLTLCRLPEAQWYKIEVHNKIKEIHKLLYQLSNSTISLGGENCDKHEIYIKDHLFDEVVAHFNFPSYVKLKRVMP